MFRKTISLIAVLAMIFAIPAFSLAAGGADTVTSASPPKPAKTTPPKTNKTTPPKTSKTTRTSTRLSDFSADKTYTLEEMLAYAAGDEHALQAFYAGAVTVFGSQEPFARLLGEENGLAEQLALVLATHGAALPDPSAVPEQPAPAALREAVLAGIRAERISMEMYAAFLAQDDVPPDARAVFQQLLDAAQNHHDALYAMAAGEGWIGGAANQDDRDVDDDDDDGRDDDKDAEYEDDKDDDKDDDKEDDQEDEKDEDEKDDGGDD